MTEPMGINEIFKLPVWVNWRSESGKDGRPTKIPYDPKTGRRAKSNDPATWGTYEQAVKAMKEKNYNGVGLNFFECDDGSNFVLIGIDIDVKEDKPHLSPEEIQDIIGHFGSYAEVSPSGKGYHILSLVDKTKIPADYKQTYYQKNPSNGVEVYIAGQTKRFFTFTGKGVYSEDVEERTPELLQLLDKHMKRPKKEKPSTPPPASPGVDKQFQFQNDIITIARNAKNGQKFSALYDHGDISMYNGDDSSADIALCNMLAFYCQGDFNKIDRLFRQSALYREKWERQDYRMTTINKAIDECNGQFYDENYRPPGRPKKVKPDTAIGGSLILGIDELQIYLEKKQMVVRYNVITNSLDISGLESAITKEHSQNALPVVIYDQLRRIYGDVSKSDVRDFLNVVALRNKYNPVLDLIQSEKWDGVDRLSDVYDILKIAKDDSLSQILIYKWLWQCLSLARNTHTENQEPYGGDGALVLVGKQGIGKTSFFRTLAMKSDFFLEGAKINIDNKDSVISATSRWIVELGEIGSTFRHDLDGLKAFITKQEDTYRKPYGHSDLKITRKTSYCGSCNDTEYLIDKTGNRRFWTVLINGVDLDALKNLNVLQLWAQMEVETHHNSQGFRLSYAEQADLEKRNIGHEKPIKGLEEIFDLLAKANKNDQLEYREVTVSDFKREHDVLRNYSVKQIGEALEKAGKPTPEKLIRVDGKVGRYRELPMYKKQ
jgi:hypothetical protein